MKSGERKREFQIRRVEWSSAFLPINPSSAPDSGMTPRDLLSRRLSFPHLQSGRMKRTALMGLL